MFQMASRSAGDSGEMWVPQGPSDGSAPVERSRFLEEYSKHRPLSAGMRPRSLISKVVQAAGYCADDSEGETECDPWVLEGWGDEPSVPEKARQASTKMLPRWAKNMPCALPGGPTAGGGGTTGRRFTSAGPHGRPSPSVAAPGGRGAGRRGGVGAPGTNADSPPKVGMRRGAALRVRPSRQPMADLEVGDESDVEPADLPVPRGGAAAAGGPGMGGRPGAGPAGARPGQPNTSHFSATAAINAMAAAVGKPGGGSAGPGHGLWGGTGLGAAGASAPPQAAPSESGSSAASYDGNDGLPSPPMSASRGGASGDWGAGDAIGAGCGTRPAQGGSATAMLRASGAAAGRSGIAAMLGGNTSSQYQMQQPSLYSPSSAAAAAGLSAQHSGEGGPSSPSGSEPRSPTQKISPRQVGSAVHSAYAGAPGSRQVGLSNSPAPQPLQRRLSGSQQQAGGMDALPVGSPMRAMQAQQLSQQAAAVESVNVRQQVRAKLQQDLDTLVQRRQAINKHTAEHQPHAAAHRAAAGAGAAGAGDAAAWMMQQLQLSPAQQSQQQQQQQQPSNQAGPRLRRMNSLGSGGTGPGAGGGSVQGGGTAGSSGAPAAPPGLLSGLGVSGTSYLGGPGAATAGPPQASPIPGLPVAPRRGAAAGAAAGHTPTKGGAHAVGGAGQGHARQHGAAGGAPSPQPSHQLPEMSALEGVGISAWGDDGGEPLTPTAHSLSGQGQAQQGGWSDSLEQQLAVAGGAVPGNSSYLRGPGVGGVAGMHSPLPPSHPGGPPGPQRHSGFGSAAGPVGARAGSGGGPASTAGPGAGAAAGPGGVAGAGGGPGGERTVRRISSDVGYGSGRRFLPRPSADGPGAQQAGGVGPRSPVVVSKQQQQQDLIEGDSLDRAIKGSPGIGGKQTSIQLRGLRS